MDHRRMGRADGLVHLEGGYLPASWDVGGPFLYGVIWIIGTVALAAFAIGRFA